MAARGPSLTRRGGGGGAGEVDEDKAAAAAVSARTDEAGGTLWWLLDGFAGTVDRSFFKVPKWVDLSLPPGHTSQADQVGRPGWWLQYPTLRFIFYSPNLVWLTWAVVSFLLYPPDMGAPARDLTARFVLGRVLLHFAMMNIYFMFWHWAMYVRRMGVRKFSAEAAGPSASRMAHNLWYAALGAVQSGLWDALYAHMFAAGKLPYVSPAEAFSSPWEVGKLLFWVAFVPMWRDFHFYLAHRFIHLSFVYRYVHSLHHRNTDIEPYAGLTMHPVEHLYYFGCAGVAAYMHASPFIVYWTLVHALISPAASHSGWEDNFQSDQYHFLHHAKFECNYGTSGTPLDKNFGTFRDKFGHSQTYKGQWQSGAARAAGDESAAAGAPLPYLRGGLSLSGAVWGRWDQALYDLCCCVGIPYLLYAALQMRHGISAWQLPLAGGTALRSPQLVGAAVAAGPLVLAWLLFRATGGHLSWRWPFHRDPILSNFGPHLLVQALGVVLPVYHSVTTLLSDSGSPPVYCSIFQC